MYGGSAGEPLREVRRRLQAGTSTLSRLADATGLSATRIAPWFVAGGGFPFEALGVTSTWRFQLRERLLLVADLVRDPRGRYCRSGRRKSRYRKGSWWSASSKRRESLVGRAVDVWKGQLVVLAAEEPAHGPQQHADGHRQARGLGGAANALHRGEWSVERCHDAGRIPSGSPGQFSAALSPARSGAPKTMRLRVAT